MKKRYIYRFLEFFIVGFAMGIVEDLIAIHFATDAAITPRVIYIAALVALPFAIFSELIVDWKHMKSMKRRWEKKVLSPKKKQLKTAIDSLGKKSLSK